MIHFACYGMLLLALVSLGAAVARQPGLGDGAAILVLAILCVAALRAWRDYTGGVRLVMVCIGGVAIYGALAVWAERTGGAGRLALLLCGASAVCAIANAFWARVSPGGVPSDWLIDSVTGAFWGALPFAIGSATLVLLSRERAAAQVQYVLSCAAMVAAIAPTLTSVFILNMGLTGNSL
ncbi:MAG TPA: hypothetical protein VKA84_13125 [Gemmatimonadaceae bacterium]|nr:hypothetical protein [Gemmatimonadaceae bacterium]